MSATKPEPRGFVVDHKESKVRYAVSASNFNPRIHDKVRPLKVSETVRGYKPKAVPKDEPKHDQSTATPALKPAHSPATSK